MNTQIFINKTTPCFNCRTETVEAREEQVAQITIVMKTGGLVQ